MFLFFCQVFQSLGSSECVMQTKQELDHFSPEFSFLHGKHAGLATSVPSHSDMVKSCRVGLCRAGDLPN